MASCMEGHTGCRPYRMLCHERIQLFPVSPFMFHFIRHVPQTDGCCEAQSTTFNSSINQASPHVMNYWLSVLRGNSLFLFSPLTDVVVFFDSSLGPRCITERLFSERKWEYKFTGTSGVEGTLLRQILWSHYYTACEWDFGRCRAKEMSRSYTWNNKKRKSRVSSKQTIESNCLVCI